MMSRALPWGVPSTTSYRTTSPSSFWAASSARLPPIWPAPMRAIFLRAMVSMPFLGCVPAWRARYNAQRRSLQRRDTAGRRRGIDEDPAWAARRALRPARTAATGARPPRILRAARARVRRPGALQDRSPPSLPAHRPGARPRGAGRRGPRAAQGPGRPGDQASARRGAARQRGRVPPALAPPLAARLPRSAHRRLRRDDGGPGAARARLGASRRGAGPERAPDGADARHRRRDPLLRRRGPRCAGGARGARRGHAALHHGAHPLCAPARQAAPALDPALPSRRRRPGSPPLPHHRGAPARGDRPRRPALDAAALAGRGVGGGRGAHDGPPAPRRGGHASARRTRDDFQRAGLDLLVPLAKPRRRGAAARAPGRGAGGPRAVRGRLPAPRAVRARAGGVDAALPAGVGRRPAGGGADRAARPSDRAGRRPDPAAVGGSPRPEAVARPAALRPRSLPARGEGRAAAVRVFSLRRRTPGLHRRGVRLDGGHAGAGRAGAALSLRAHPRPARGTTAARHTAPRPRAARLRAAAARDVASATRQKWRMMASPNSEHFTSLTPFSPSAVINRAKSYVTVRAPMAPSMPLTIRSAASSQPRWRSIRSPERITEPGFTLSWSAYLGAVPWVASNTAWPVT